MRGKKQPATTLELGILVVGCVTLLMGAVPGPIRVPPPRRITVFAAASLTEAFKDVATALARRDSSLIIQFSFAGSQQLASQLEQGAQGDVFASADQRWMDHARDDSLLSGAPVVFVRNRLVVIVPRTNPARIDRLQDLARRGVKLVLAGDAVPAGRYSRDVLQNLSQAPEFGRGFSGQVLANVVSDENDVKSVVAKVQLGEADAGMVYRSDITPAVARFVTALEIPEAQNVIAGYPIAVLRSSPDPAAARQFINFLLASDGQHILVEHGFLGAPSAP
jgi:molybdate transport system substrate-binding protein